MTENDPHYWVTLIQNLWMVVLAVWGGLVAFYQRWRSDGEPFSWLVFFGEMSTSALTGLLVLYGCIEMGVSTPVTGIATALAGHAGGSLLKTAEKALRRRVVQVLGEDDRGPKS